MKESISKIDEEKYFKILKPVASLSNLFSNNKKNIPYLQSRFIEKLFILVSLENKKKVVDVANKDISFDCIVDKHKGVQIKTFQSDKKLNNVSKQKIAQFKHRSDEINELTGQDLCRFVGEQRNNRLMSHAREYGIELTKSYYHCLVRLPGKGFIHEEQLRLVDIDSLKFKPQSTTNTKSFEFSDKYSAYSYSKSDSTLHKIFNFQKFYNSKIFKLPIIPEKTIFSKLNDFYNFFGDEFAKKTIQSEFDFSFYPENQFDDSSNDFVILPLYGTSKKYKEKTVQFASGINAWNANDTKRPRKFGECYILVPEEVKNKKLNFFPIDRSFKIKLPNEKVIDARLVQQNKKALQSNPLTDLCDWLYSLIDITETNWKERFNKKKIYTYADLQRIGSDSVKIEKVINKSYEFTMCTMPVGSYENFINEENFEEFL